MKPKNLSLLGTRRPLILGQIVCVGCATGDFWGALDWSLSLCRLAAKWFCVIAGRTSCYRQSRWQSASAAGAPRIRNDEGGFKPAARLGSAGIAALPDVTITSQRGCQPPTRRPRALAAPWATSSVAQACEEKAPLFRRRRVPSLCFISLKFGDAATLSDPGLEVGSKGENPNWGRRFCEELRCFWRTDGKLKKPQHLLRC